jgi:1,2-phenylacetyl-CoA epoxidase catalytic subunit
MPKQRSESLAVKFRRERAIQASKSPKTTLCVVLSQDRQYRALAALAAFNQTTMESCATRILSEVLCERAKEMEFHGLMCV